MERSAKKPGPVSTRSPPKGSSKGCSPGGHALASSSATLAPQPGRRAAPTRGLRWSVGTYTSCRPGEPPSAPTWTRLGPGSPHPEPGPDSSPVWAGVGVEAARQPSREATDLATSSGSGVTGSARGHPADALLHQPRAWAADKLGQTDNQEESWGQSLSQTLRGVHPRILGPTAHPRARAPHAAKLHTRGCRRQAGSSRQQAPQPHPAVPSLRCFPTSKSQHPAQLLPSKGLAPPPDPTGARTLSSRGDGQGTRGSRRGTSDSTPALGGKVGPSRGWRLLLLRPGRSASRTWRAAPQLPGQLASERGQKCTHRHTHACEHCTHTPINTQHTHTCTLHTYTQTHHMHLHILTHI